MDLYGQWNQYFYKWVDIFFTGSPLLPNIHASVRDHASNIVSFKNELLFLRDLWATFIHT